MQYIGEIISLCVSVLWTISALAAEVGSKRLGVFVMNVWRMGVALVLSALLMWAVFGVPYPAYASNEAWGWLLLSGFVGYFFGDWCLFNSYLSIGSRYGQLLMTLAPMFTAIFAWIMLGQTLGWNSLLAMAVTLLGIAISVLGRGEKHTFALQLPTKGILFGIGAGLGQGVGLVLSKIGLDKYTASVPAEVLPNIETYLPFGANMVRCLAGLVCFYFFYLIISHKKNSNIKTIRQSLHNRKVLLAMLTAVFAGPFIGVSLSLMALNYTAAGIASTLMALSPILILVPSYHFFHLSITLKSIIGAIVSCVGVSLFFLL